MTPNFITQYHPLTARPFRRDNTYQDYIPCKPLRLYALKLCSVKEMTANPNIAVCAGNFYFTGKAKPLGSVYDAGNAEIKAAYMTRYPDSFGKEDEFIQSDEVFFELTTETVSEWVFAGGNPTGFAEQHFSPEAFEQ